MPIPTAAYGPKITALVAPTTTVVIRLDHARDWRARITNSHAGQAITAITLAESPMGTGYGPETATLGALAPSASMDVQGSDDSSELARFTFSVAAAGEVTIELAGV